MAEHSLAKRCVSAILRSLARLLAVLVYRIRCRGRQNYPRQGGALICANHQSFMDPLLVGLSCNRLLSYLARESLFHFPLFGRLIQFLGAIPLDRSSSGLRGLKETLRRLKRGEMVLIFPEGTRTYDGQVAPLKPGFCALARRSRVPLIPVALDGAYDAWPRWSPLPRRAIIHLHIGEPISPQMVASLPDEQLVAELERRIRACHAQARSGRLDRRA